MIKEKGGTTRQIWGREILRNWYFQCRKWFFDERNGKILLDTGTFVLFDHVGIDAVTHICSDEEEKEF